LASAKEIPPGGEGKVDVEFKTAGKSGIREQSITVISNDPFNSSQVLKVKANLEVYFECKERMVSFGRIPRSDTVTKRVEFSGKYLKETGIKSIQLFTPEGTAPADPEFSKALTWTINDQRSTEPPQLSVEFTLNPSGLKIGPFRETVKVKTTAENPAELDIQVTGEILGPITTDPPRLFFNFSDDPQSLTRKVTVKSTDGKEFGIIEVTCEDQGIRIAKPDSNKSQSHELTISIVPDYQGDRIRTELLLKLTHPDSNELRIPVSGFRRQNPAGSTTMNESKQAPKAMQLNTGNTLSNKGN